MADIVVDTYKLNQYAQRISAVNNRIKRLDRRLDSLYWRVGLQGLWNLMQADALTCYSWRLLRCQDYLSQTATDFESVEKVLLGQDPITFKNVRDLRSVYSAFIDEFKSKYSWKEILSGAGYIGTIYDLITDIKKGKSWRDFAKTGVDVYQFFSGAAKTYKNYKKIGNVVGTKTAMTWWAKKVTGLKPLGRASTARNPVARFVNNLTNKTSPFNAQFKNVINNFKGTNGVGKAVASWGAVAVNGVMNFFSNKEEQATSNGKMSDARVVAETITETAVDTVLTYGAGIVVGAAVTTVLGSVAAPGVLVVAASGLVVAGLNAGVKALTGKTTTEWISDGILNTGKAIGKATNVAVKAVGKWFKRIL